MKDKILAFGFLVIGAIFIYLNFWNVSMNPIRMAEAANENRGISLMIADWSGIFWFLPTGLVFLCLTFLGFLSTKNHTYGNICSKKVVRFSFNIFAGFLVFGALFFVLSSINTLFGFIFHIPTFILALLVFIIGRKITRLSV
mgnify:CR=1 FL=1